MASALQTLFSDIANAIRGKTGNADKMSPSSFPTQIENIPTSGGVFFTTDVLVDETTVTFTAEENGGYDGLFGKALPLTDTWMKKPEEEQDYQERVFLVTFDGVRYCLAYQTGVVAAKFTFGGTEYTNHPLVFLGNWNYYTSMYGGNLKIEWLHECQLDYPFMISIANITSSYTVSIYGKTAGTHTVKIERMPITF